MKIKIAILTALLAMSLPTKSKAQGIPVYDASSFVQMVTQLDQMSKDYQKQLEQLDQAIKQSDAITGTRNMGSLANGSLEQQLREYLPNTWEETMAMMNATSLPSGAYGTQGIYNNLYNDYAPLSGADYVPNDPDGYLAKALDRKTGTTFGAMAAGEQAYNNIAARMQTYQTLLNELDNTTDLKSSVDLQARISAENGLIMSEIMRLNAIQIQQSAASDNEVLMDYRRASSANKYDAAQAKEAVKLEE